MKPVLKWLFAQHAVQWVLAALVSGYIGLVRLSCKKVVVGAPGPHAFWDQKRPTITAIWHGRLLLIPQLFNRAGAVHALISASRDGQAIQKVARLCGLKVIEGSSTRGGAAALKQMIARAQQGDSLFITPDGPKGPRMHLQKGVVDVARMTGLPLFPVAISAAHGTFIKSWDRFFIPRPFSTLYIVWGEAVTIPRTLDDTAHAATCRTVENALRDVQQKADTLAGHPPVLPATDGTRKG